MIKQLLLVFLLIVSVGLSGCTSKPEPIEYKIINVRMIETTEIDELRNYDFDVTYINSNGYIKFISTSYARDSRNIVRLKQSDSNEYELLWVGSALQGDVFELYIPQNTTLIL